MHRGDYGIYGVIDQQLYRTKNGDGDSGVSVFRRGSVSPSDRNRSVSTLTGGIVFKGMVPESAKRQLRRGHHLRSFSDSVRAFDQDRINFGTLSTPPRVMRPISSLLRLPRLYRAGSSSRSTPISGIRVALASVFPTHKSQAFALSSDSEKTDPPGRGHCRAGRSDRREDGRGGRRSNGLELVITNPDQAHIAPAVITLHEPARRRDMHTGVAYAFETAAAPISAPAAKPMPTPVPQ